MRPGWWGTSALAAVSALLAGCVPPPGQVGGLSPVRFDQIPGWQADNLAQTLPALHVGCRRLGVLPADTALGGDGLAAQAGGLAGKWSASCTAARALVPGDAPAARRFYETWFQPYRIGTPGLFTGYYEPEVRGALVQGGPYQTPVLSRPADLVQQPVSPDAPTAGRQDQGHRVAYWTRADIEAGRMGDQARPLFWLASPVDLFFLQVQGSGRVRLPDGAVVRLGYDGKNGRPYTPIGRILLDRHALAAGDVSMQSIRAWLTAHPDQAAAVMDRNEDYVFFRVLDTSQTDQPGSRQSNSGQSGSGQSGSGQSGADQSGFGPPGALGVKLQPGRTAAVDRHSIPLGAPIFVDTTDPVSGQPWRRLLLAQDVGSDIIGAARTDIFLGAGDTAEAQAGRMHEAGVEYVLLPRG